MNLQNYEVLTSSTAPLNVEPLFKHVYGVSCAGEAPTKTTKFAKQKKHSALRADPLTLNENEVGSLLRSYVALSGMHSTLETPSGASLSDLVSDVERIANGLFGNMEREAAAKRRLEELEWRLDTISTLSWSRGTSLPRDAVAGCSETLSLLEAALSVLPQLCDAARQVREMECNWQSIVPKIENCAALYASMLEAQKQIEKLEESCAQAHVVLEEFTESLESLNV